MESNKQSFTADFDIKECQESGWQVCPKCQGQGVLFFPTGWPYVNEYITDGAPCICDVCEGKKIINIQTGKPPQ